MRYGLIGSILFHIVVLGLVIFNFAGGSPVETPTSPPPVSVEIMSPSEFSDRQSGKMSGTVQKPLPVAEVKAPESPAAAKKEAEPKPAPRPAEKEALLPPPPPKAAEPPPKPVEQAKPEKSEPPVEKVVEKPAPKKEAEKKPAPKPKEPDPEPKRAETRASPQREFDPNRIASLLEKDAPQQKRPTTQSQATAEAPPSKAFADRQTAILSRDPNAGASSDNYQPNKPWRPASSLNEQAMGLPDAKGATNAASDADILFSQISRQWDLPYGGAGAEHTVITLHFRLKPDGMVAGEPEIVGGSRDPLFQASADAAVRAVLRAQPFRFPQARYDQFRDNTISFDPRDMYAAGRG